MGAFGQNRTIVGPFTPFLCVVESKGPINKQSDFKLFGRLIDVRENNEKGTLYCLVQLEEKKFTNDKEKKIVVKLSLKDFKMEELNTTSR